MSNFGKISVLVFLWFSLFSFGFAATGTSLDWSWDLLKYSDNLEKQLINLVDSGYDKLYFDFQKTWLNLIKTVDYQSLICLWVLSGEDNILVNLQKGKQNIKKNILKDFADMEIEIMSLEEKNRILKDKWINLFYDKSTYEESKNNLKKDIDKLVKIRNEEINTYTKKYTELTKSFVWDFASYKTANNVLISKISNKIFGIQWMFDNYAELNSKISNLNWLLLGSTAFANSIASLKNKALDSYEKKLTQLVEKSVKRYKKVSWLESALEDEKQKAVDQYWLLFDETLSKIFTKWYRYDRYTTLKDSLDDMKRLYYVKWNLNCQKILSSDEKLQAKINLLNSDIINVLSSVNSGSKSAQNTWNIKKFKSDLVSAISLFYKTVSENQYKTFSKTMSQKIRELNNPTPVIEETISTWSNDVVVDIWNSIVLDDIDQNFYFKKPFKTNEKNEDIKILQNLLIKLSYYTGSINGIYDNATLNAVYSLQKENGLLKWYEKKLNVRWWMWPATRKILNTYLGK